MLAKGISRGLPDIQGAVSLTAGAMSGVAFPNMSSLPKDNSMLNGLLNIFGGVRQDNNDNTTPVELTIDGQVFARLIMPSLTKELKRNGINLEDK